MSDHYLYLFGRTDLDSMGNGKFGAHTAHAANQFTWDMGVNPRGALEDHASNTWGYSAHQWALSAGGFGTTITLAATLREMEAAVAMVSAMNYPAALTVDPEYPYFLHKEYAGLIDHPEDHPPVPFPSRGKGMMLCIRPETTSGYLFGPPDVIKPVTRHLPLVPDEGL